MSFTFHFVLGRKKRASSPFLCLPFLLLLSVFRTVLETMGLQGKVQPQKARNKWDRLKNKYKVCAGLNDDVETKLYFFYPCKLIHNLLKIADLIGFHCLRIANIQGQERASRKPSAATWPWFVLMGTWGVRTEAFHRPAVLTASIPEDTPGPNDQEEEDDDNEEEESQLGLWRRRRREDEEVYEASERTERLLSAPEDNPYIISGVIQLIYELFLNYLWIIVHFI